MTGDKIHSYLPSDDEIERALNEALADDGRTRKPGTHPRGALSDIRPDALIRGRVLAVDPDRVLLDIGYKAEGVIPRSEFPAEPPKVGQEIEAVVIAVEDENGEVALSVEEAGRRRVLDSFGESAQGGQILDGVVRNVVKGGLVVDVSGIRTFLPAREADVRFVEDLNAFVGQAVRVRVIERDEKNDRVVVSRRSVLEEEREREKTGLFETLAAGQILTGKVIRLTDFGAFVDLGGVDGLIFTRDLAWGAVKQPSDVVKVGQEVRVAVLNFDRDKGKIALGLKQVGPSPWDEAATRYAVGTRHRARIRSTLEFGAIAEIVPGIEGLIHVSEMSWKGRINSPSEVVRIGDEVDVSVLALDADKRKISLSMKQAEANPWTNLGGRFPWPTFVRGKVTRFSDFGAFLEITEARIPDAATYQPVDPPVEGLVHVTEISWTQRFEHPNQALKLAQVVDALVIETDEARRRIKLSIKQVEPDPWWDAEERFAVGKEMPGVVRELRAFGAFVEVAPGLLGLVHRSRFGPNQLREGQRVTVRVEEVSEADRRLGLGLVDRGGEDLPD